MTKAKAFPILGQEAITPRGMGRVTYYPATLEYIRVRLYVDGDEVQFEPRNVELVNPRAVHSP